MTKKDKKIKEIALKIKEELEIPFCGINKCPFNNRSISVEQDLDLCYACSAARIVVDEFEKLENENKALKKTLNRLYSIENYK